MPNGGNVFLLNVPVRAQFRARMADQIAILAKVLVTNNF
jgi:hypothetical protein